MKLYWNQGAILIFINTNVKTQKAVSNITLMTEIYIAQVRVRVRVATIQNGKR